MNCVLPVADPGFVCAVLRVNWAWFLRSLRASLWQSGLRKTGITVYSLGGLWVFQNENPIQTKSIPRPVCLPGCVKERKDSASNNEVCQNDLPLAAWGPIHTGPTDASASKWNLLLWIGVFTLDARNIKVNLPAGLQCGLGLELCWSWCWGWTQAPSGSDIVCPRTPPSVSLCACLFVCLSRVDCTLYTVKTVRNSHCATLAVTVSNQIGPRVP